MLKEQIEIENSNLVAINELYNLWPHAYLISNRLNDMIECYGKMPMLASIILAERSRQYEITLHIENLINTYGIDAVNDVLSIIFCVEYGKVSTDFNIDD